MTTTTQTYISPFNATANNIIRELTKGGLTFFSSVTTHSKDVPYQISLGEEDHVKTDSLFFHVEGKVSLVIVELTHRRIERLYGDDTLLSLQAKVMTQVTEEKWDLDRCKKMTALAHEKKFNRTINNASTSYTDLDILDLPWYSRYAKMSNWGDGHGSWIQNDVRWRRVECATDVKSNHVELARTLVQSIMEIAPFLDDGKMKPLSGDYLYPSYFDQGVLSTKFWDTFNARYFRNEVVS